MKSKKIELLSPAGDWVALRAVISAGADSVYFGVKTLNMRHSASNFDVTEIKKIIDLLHKHHVKGYLVLNTIIMNDELEQAFKILDEAKKASVDAVIMWDMALLAYAKKIGIPIHLSTQASVANIQALEAFAELGVKRVVLARECTLGDITQMIQLKKQKKIPCEIETFIHGALCVSISGRCFLSLYAHGKSANKGQCFQPCRREYLISEVQGDQEFVVGKDYILSPKDLCTIDFIDLLIESGIDSFKIEGRIRPTEYSKIVTSAYREAIDCYYDGSLSESKKKELKAKLNTVYHRGFSTGFYFGQPTEEFSRGMEHLYEKAYVGDVLKYYKNMNVAEVLIRSEKIQINDQALFIGKKTDLEVFTITELESNHQKIKEAEKGTSVGIKVPYQVKPKDKLYLWREKYKKEKPPL